MLLVWRDVKSVILWGVLPHSQTIVVVLRGHKLQRLDDLLALVRPRHDRVLFLYDIALPHAAKWARKELPQ